jgi:hypothetical protein
VKVDLGGIVVPDAGPVFLVALAGHVLAGATAVVSGALAAASAKGPGRHPRVGRVYLAGLSGVFATASVMAALRWDEDRSLFAIACVALGLAAAGWWARRRAHRDSVRKRLIGHAMTMPASYTALLTGFYVDNGPHLPVWEHLPSAVYWLLPAAVAVPLTWRAMRRNGLLPRPPGHPYFRRSRSVARRF